MNKKVSKNENDLKWCFAIVNGKLGEVFFNKNKTGKPKVHSHCYVKREEYSKKEQKMIAADTLKCNFIWKNGIYKLKV